MTRSRSAALCCPVLLLLFCSPALAGNGFGAHADRVVYGLYASAAYKARTGNWLGAAADYEQAYRLRQNSPEILVRLAEAYFRTGRGPEAEKFAMRALDEDSAAFDAYVVLTDIALEKGDAAGADAYLRKRLAGAPDDLESRLKLGLIRENVDDLQGVVEAFEGYPPHRPGSAAANFHRGIALARLKRVDEARAAFREALRENPGYIDAAENIALLSEELGNDTEAIEEWEAVLAIDPAQPDALRRKVTLLLQNSMFDTAERDLARLLEIAPDKSGTLKKLLAQVAIQNRDFAGAARIMIGFARTSSTETGYIETAQVAAQAGTETGILVEALEDAYSLGERSPIGIVLLKTYLVTGDSEKEKILFEKMRLRYSTDTPVLWSLALLHHRTGDETSAIEVFLDIVKLEPSNATALNYVGYTWAERGENLAEAEALIRRALAVEPENAQYIDSLGWVYFQEGKCAEARAELRKALEKLPDEPTILEHMGDVLRKLGSSDEALDFYQKSLDTGRSENEESLRKKIQELE